MGDQNTLEKHVLVPLFPQNPHGLTWYWTRALWWEAHDYLPEQWHDLLCDELLCFIWEKFCNKERKSYSPNRLHKSLDKLQLTYTSYNRQNLNSPAVSVIRGSTVFALYLQYINPLSTVPLNPNTSADNWSTFCCKWPFLHRLILFLVYHTFLILNTSKKKYMLKNWSVYLFPKFGNSALIFSLAKFSTVFEFFHFHVKL
jgi:hypothetical protein